MEKLPLCNCLLKCANHDDEGHEGEQIQQNYNNLLGADHMLHPEWGGGGGGGRVKGGVIEYLEIQWQQIFHWQTISQTNCFTDNAHAVIIIC